MAKKAAKAPPALPPGASRVEWNDARELPLLAAEQLHVRVVQGRYYLTFGQLNLPVFEGPPPDDFIAEIRPVARLVLSTTDVESIVRVLSQVLGTVRTQEG